MRGVPALLVATALIAGACSDDDTDADREDGADDVATETTVAEPAGGGARFVRALVPFDSCAAFLDHVRAEARERVGPYGLDGQGWGWGIDDVAAEEPAAEEPAADTAVPVPAEGGAPTDGSDDGFTTTNVQEAGVDEPDIVKTDGDRILIVSENVLTYVDISSGSPVVTDRIQLDLGWGHQLFFAGDRALLFTNGGGWGVPMPVDLVAGTSDAEADFAEPIVDDTVLPPESWVPAAVVIEVDLSDPADLRVAGTMRIEGQYLSARAIGDHVRLAVTSAPIQLPWLAPQTPAGEERATRANREIVDETTIEDWVPEYEIVDENGSSSGPLVPCERLHRPADFSGFDVVSVIDLDLGAGLAPAVDAVGVLAGGQTVYSSMDRFYVATTKWKPPSTGDASVDDDHLRQWSSDFVTEVHAFAIAAGEPTTYVASGAVPGTLLNQFSLDEHGGDLRVLATEGTPWDERRTSETFLTVLREDGDRLAEIGRVGGLGKGEQLYSARLMGDVGFAVTFRQVDPFYVLDLADPTAPRVAGELKIPGFSTYLHPVGEGRVLGVGQDATEGGRTLGLKLSLFDVSDPAAPRELAVWTMPDANSPVEFDHRAFQMWGSMAIVPVQSWMGSFNGVVLFEVGGDDIVEVGRVSHEPLAVDPATDCRIVDQAVLTPDASELWYIAGEGRVQVCGPDDAGGWPDAWCERIPAADVPNWFWDPETAEQDLAALGLGPDDRLEFCWPDGGHQDAIQRSLVADGTLFTVSTSALQANALDGLAVIGQVPLR